MSRNKNELLGRVIDYEPSPRKKNSKWTVQTASGERYPFMQLSLLDPKFHPSIGEVVHFAPSSIDADTTIAVQVKEANKETGKKFNRKCDQVVLKDSTKSNRQSLTTQIIYRPSEVCSTVGIELPDKKPLFRG